MLQSIKSWLVQTGYLTRQQLAEAEEYREAVGCSLARALWSLRSHAPRQVCSTRVARFWTGPA
jgi:hypothetical protein